MRFTITRDFSFLVDFLKLNLLLVHACMHVYIIVLK